jgi:hypothetical protein
MRRPLAAQLRAMAHHRQRRCLALAAPGYAGFLGPGFLVPVLNLQIAATSARTIDQPRPGTVLPVDWPGLEDLRRHAAMPPDHAVVAEAIHNEIACGPVIGRLHRHVIGNDGRICVRNDLSRTMAAGPMRPSRPPSRPAQIGTPRIDRRLERLSQRANALRLEGLPRHVRVASVSVRMAPSRMPAALRKCATGSYQRNRKSRAENRRQRQPEGPGCGTARNSKEIVEARSPLARCR